MTITNTPLYRALAKGVRKEDHAELARMLGMVDQDAWGTDFKTKRLGQAFIWGDSPQGDEYWLTLSHALEQAGYECW